MKFDIKKLRENIKDTHIAIEKHPTEDLYIYGYFKSPISREKSIWNKYSIQCRGLILNSKGYVIERCFPKFWTYRNHLSENVVRLSENKIVKLPDEKPKIYEKVDGTMGILYWIKDVPYIATQRSFSSLKAIKASEIIQNKYLKEAQNLDRKYSYLFEVLYEKNSLVIDYKGIEDLILIGALNKENGAAADINIENLGFPIKKDYTQKYGHLKSLSDIEALDLPNLEGFVLEYSKVRIKVKFPWYKAVSKEISNLVAAEFQKAESIRFLKKHYNIKKNELSLTDIKKSIENKDNDFKEIKKKLTMEHIDKGAYRWIDENKNTCLLEKKDEFFIDSDIYKNSVPDDKLWDWKARFLEYYYD